MHGLLTFGWKNKSGSRGGCGIIWFTTNSVGRRCRDASVDCKSGREGSAAAPPYQFNRFVCHLDDSRSLIRKLEKPAFVVILRRWLRGYF
jgi:hypothetical protein